MRTSWGHRYHSSSGRGLRMSRLGAVCRGGSSHSSELWTLELPGWPECPMGPGPASTTTGAHPQVKVPAGDPGPSRGPWELHESNTGQNPWTFLLPVCPSTSTKAKATIKSYSRENALPFNRNGVQCVLITKVSKRIWKTQNLETTVPGILSST